MSQKGSIIFLISMLLATTMLYIVYTRLIWTRSETIIDSEEDLDYSLIDVVNNKTLNIVRTVDQNSSSLIRYSHRPPYIRLIFTYRDLEAQLCRKEVDWSNKTMLHESTSTGPCPEKGIVTIPSGGRTGNQLWTYASVWAVARSTGLLPFIPSCIRKNLDPIFEQLTIPTFKDIANCPIEFNTFAMSLDEWTSDTNQNIILPRFSGLWAQVAPYLKDLVEEYRFVKEIKDKADEILLDIVKGMPSKPYTFVGVHVRRTDYIKFLRNTYKQDPVKPQFFVNAMDYYKGKYPNCLFVFVSDDPTWCAEHFGTLEGVVVTSNNTAAVDLAIMASCNHSIFDYGTYGEWGSILAGGEVVSQDFRISRPMKNLIRISQNTPHD